MKKGRSSKKSTPKKAAGHKRLTGKSTRTRKSFRRTPPGNKATAKNETSPAPIPQEGAMPPGFRVPWTTRLKPYGADQYLYKGHIFRPGEGYTIAERKHLYNRSTFSGRGSVYFIIWNSKAIPSRISRLQLNVLLQAERRITGKESDIKQLAVRKNAVAKKRVAGTESLKPIPKRPGEKK